MDIDSGIFTQPGDSWQPESAARFNAVNETLCGFGTIGPASFASEDSGGTDSLLCKNVSDSTIPAGSYVTLSYLEQQTGDLFANICAMKPGVLSPCGVVTDDCPPGEYAEVKISGIVQAKISPAPPDVMVIPSPLPDGMTFVNLNSCGSDVYRNYFKVSATGFAAGGTISKVCIYDGGDPASYTAGVTDIDTVSRTELEHDFITGTTIFLCLEVKQNADGSKYFSHTFEVNPVENDKKPMVCLAQIGRNNTVIQRWTGGKIWWRERFIIPFYREFSS